MGFTYKDAGVDIDAGDAASKAAYAAAKSTFSSRKGMIGDPVVHEGGFTGFMDMGDFYQTLCSDGVGTKVEIAQYINNYETLGKDLLAMVCDDNVCVGAETISINNIIDTKKVNPNEIDTLMKGLASASIAQKITISGGEIAELGSLVSGITWNATALGIVKKDKIITGNNIEAGDKIISLYEAGFRSNGFTLIRKIIENNVGENGYNKNTGFSDKTWGQEIITPSVIYSAAVLNLIGRYGEERKFDIKAIAHITGGGISGNLNRVLSGVGARLDNLFEPSKMVQEIQKLGGVEDDEAYKTWNMGNGMMLVCKEEDSDGIIQSLESDGIKAQAVGEVIEEKVIEFTSKGVFDNGKVLKYEI